MHRTVAAFGVAALIGSAFIRAQPAKPPASVALSDISWPEAEAALTPSAVVVLPLGAAAVEHGPHLKLGHDERIARYVTARVRAATAVVVAPPLTYHFHPALLDYPGSTSLTDTTARDLTVDVVRGLARSGPRRFYVINIGVQTMGPLSRAATELSRSGILLGYTDLQFRLGTSDAKAHADEVETSMMLYVDPSAVDMTKAVREMGRGSGPLTRKADAPGLYSASGVVGDPTLATRDKGQAYVERLVAGVLEDIDKLRGAPLPVERTALPPPPRPAPARVAPPQETRMPNGCTAGEERAIRLVGMLFSTAWKELDPDKIALMFTEAGDIRHPDGLIERGRDTIAANRRELFMKREYRGSVHSVSLNDIRCLDSNTAIADGKWELRLTDSKTSFSGWCTLILTSKMGSWLIEAWRYTINPPSGTPPPNILKQPGFIGRGH